MDENNLDQKDSNFSGSSIFNSLKGRFRSIPKQALPLLVILFAVPVTIVLALSQQTFFNHAAGLDPHSIYVLQTAKSATTPGKVSIKSFVSASSIKPASGSLVNLGQWQGKNVEMVPSDRFALDKNYFTNTDGISSMLSLKNGRLIGGGYDAFFIKEKDDTGWNNLNVVQIPESFNLANDTVRRMVEDNSGNAYLFGDSGSIRLNSDDTLDKLQNPITGGDFVSEDAIAYKDGIVSFGDGPSGWGDGAIYFHSGSTAKVWLAPRPDPTVNSDAVRGIFQASESQDYFYAFVAHCACHYDPTAGTTYLYKFEIQGDNLLATRLGVVQFDKTNWRILHNINVVNVKGENILYGDAGNLTVNFSLALVRNFDPNAANINVSVVDVPGSITGTGEFKDYVVENALNGSLWMIGGQYLVGLYYTQGLGTLDTYQINFMTYEERTQFLANMYTTSMARDEANIFVASNYLPGQFKDGMVTVFENSPVPTNTPTPTPSPTPTSAPTKTLTLYPTADAYVSSANPNKNYGSATQLSIDGNPQDITYLTFDLRQLNAGNKILNARLRLRVPDISGADSIGTLRFWTADTSWQEGTIKFLNKPVLGKQVGNLPMPKRAQTYYVDLSGWLDGVPPPAPISLGINTLSYDNAIIWSKEVSGSSNKPSLVIQYQ